MKQVLKIVTHSFIDVITNSSTELFVTDNKKTVKFIRALLYEKWEHFCKLYGYDMKIDDVLIVKAITKDEAKRYHQWPDNGYFRNMKKMREGDIIIEGLGDNSIPYQFFEVIETFLNVNRYHLG